MMKTIFGFHLGDACLMIAISLMMNEIGANHCCSTIYFYLFPFYCGLKTMTSNAFWPDCANYLRCCWNPKSYYAICVR